MKALSIKQPWAWLICAGYKDIENRGWNTSFRGRIYVHTGKMVDWDMQLAIMKKQLTLPNKAEEELPAFYALRAIIGEVDIVDCVTESKSPWFIGPYGFVLKNPVLYETPIPYRGKLGFFEVELPC